MKLSSILFSLLILYSVCKADEKKPELQWGGPGFDPALKHPAYTSSRFTARRSAWKAGMIEIWVDAKETVKSVKDMALFDDDGNASAHSTYCSKAMRHLTAPQSCYFDEKDLKGLTGKGRVRVFDRKGKLVLEESIDIDSLKSL